MVSPLLLIGGLVAGGAVVTAVVRKKKAAQAIPPGIAKQVVQQSGTAKDIATDALAMAQQKLAEGVPPGQVAAAVASTVTKDVSSTVNTLLAK